MAAQRIPRVWLASPTSATFSFNSAARANSTLAGVRGRMVQRPTELPLSPNPFAFHTGLRSPVSAGISSAGFATAPTSPFVAAAATKVAKSVHFPPTPTMVSSFIPTHSNAAYDRSAIVVSPTAKELRMPGWGERVYSPSTGGFTGLTGLRSPTTVATPTMTLSFGQAVDNANAKNVHANGKPTRASVRFHANVAKAAPILPREPLDSDRLSRYPRSPYPSAPMDEAMDRGRTVERSALPTRRSSVAEAAVSKPRARPAPMNLEEDKLSQDFWQSVSVASPASDLNFVFGTRDGALWSPGLPRKENHSHSLSAVMEGMMSPGLGGAFVMPKKAKKVAKAPMKEALVTEEQEMLSPAPFDPFSAFPSFSAVLASGEQGISYPERVLRV